MPVLRYILPSDSPLPLNTKVSRVNAVVHGRSSLGLRVDMTAHVSTVTSKKRQRVVVET